MAQSDIETALNIILNNSPAFPVAWENKQSNQTGSHYIQSFMPVESSNISIEFTGAQELTGIYQILISVKIDSGKADCDIGITDLLNKFPRGLQLTSNGQTAEIEKTYISGGFRSDQWWIIPCSVMYKGFV